MLVVGGEALASQLAVLRALTGPEMLLLHRDGNEQRRRSSVQSGSWRFCVLFGKQENWGRLFDERIRLEWAKKNRRLNLAS